jgi:glucosamine--fructose-6-phosphate aminotransferase (isomerizing)
MATVRNGEIEVRRVLGSADNLRLVLESKPLNGCIGIGVNCWAHDHSPSPQTTQPHLDCAEALVTVIDGRVENHDYLRQGLVHRGHRFASGASAETIPHLIEESMRLDVKLEQAVRLALRRLTGACAILVLCRSEPTKIIAARIGCAGGVVIGWGDGETYVASEVRAFSRNIERVVCLGKQQMAVITGKGIRLLRV